MSISQIHLSKNQNEINIYKCSKQDKLCCKYGHRIIPIQGPRLRWHFRHLIYKIELNII